MSEPQQISWYSVVLLAGHLVMVGVATWSLWVLGSGLWAGAGAALLLLVAYGFLWRLRMAPAAQNRFTYRQRLTVHLILGPAVVVLAVLTSIWLPALVGVSLALLGDALASRADSQGLETD